MPRISDAELERLKAEVSVERLIEARSIALKKRGADLVGLCPFHEDREPSLVVTPSKNLWHCFGCGLGGGVIDWVMKADGVSFRHSVALLKEGRPAIAAVAVDASEASSQTLPTTPVKRSTVRRLDSPVSLDADDQALLDQVIDYYHATLKDSPEALAYLEQRGIGSVEAIETFKLGYADRTLGLRLPEKNRKAGAVLRERLIRLGLYRESGHEHFNGSVIVPIFDEAGQVVEVYGRKRRDDLRPGTPSHLYLPGPHRGVWNITALAAHREIILCEALIDALTFWVTGFRNVTASYGVQGFTEAHRSAFRQHGIQRVLIAYDSDAAGDRAAAQLATTLQAEGIGCFRLRCPPGLDANAYALQSASPDESLGALLRQAQGLGQGPPPALSTALAASASSLAAEPVVITEPTRTQLTAPAQGLGAERPPTTTAPIPNLAVPDLPVPDVAVPAALPLVAPPQVEVIPAPPGREGQEVRLCFGDGVQARHWRVRGLEKNPTAETLKVTVRVVLGAGIEGGFHLDTLDLYSARQRTQYVTQAALETGLGSGY